MSQCIGLQIYGVKDFLQSSILCSIFRYSKYNNHTVKPDTTGKYIVCEDNRIQLLMICHTCTHTCQLTSFVGVIFVSVRQVIGASPQTKQYQHVCMLFYLNADCCLYETYLIIIHRYVHTASKKHLEKPALHHEHPSW